MHEGDDLVWIQLPIDFPSREGMNPRGESEKAQAERIAASRNLPGNPLRPARSKGVAKSPAKSRRRKEPARLGKGFFSFRYRFPPADDAGLRVFWHHGFADRDGMEELRRQGAMIQAPIPIKDPRMASKFWFCEAKGEGKRGGTFVTSTRDLIRMLARGQFVHVLSGPHRSRSAAENDHEDYWEGNW